MINEINGIKNYKPSHHAMLVLFCGCGGIGALWLVMLVLRFVLSKSPDIVGMVFFGAYLLLVFGAVLPKYFKKNHLSVSEKDIVCVKGVISDKKIYLPMDAVRSVTMIITPLGDVTGMNAIVFNALGSRLIMLFMDKTDCEDIYSFVNGIIMARDNGGSMQDKNSIPAKNERA